MSNPNPSVPPVRAPRWIVWLGLAALAGYAVFLARNSTVAAGGSDSSGYLNSARLLAAGRLATEVRVPAELGGPAGLFRPDFQPLGFRATAESPRMVPTYPVGLPLHLAIAGKILGWSWGPLLCGLSAAVAAVWLCYAVGRELGLAVSLAAAAAVVLAACPVLLYTSIQPLSDTLATAWCLGAVWAALRARRHAGWSAACGAACGIAVLVRPTDIVLLPALVVLLGWRWRRLALAALAGLPAAGWLAFYNDALYGGVLRSGYPSLGTAFAASYVAPTALHFLHWLAVFLPAVLFVLPLAALGRRETRTRELLALGLWFAAITAVYLSYSISHEAWSCLRFILPAIPALVLAGMLGIDALARTHVANTAGHIRCVAALIVAVWAVVASWCWTRPHAVFYTRGYENAYTSASLTARALFPKNALVLCSLFSGSIYYYTDSPVLRWDFLDASNFGRYADRARKSGLPICAVLFDVEEQDALREHCPGPWRRLAAVGNVTLWQLGPAAEK